jgi:hypothetical protein
MAGCCLLADYMDVASTSLLVRMQFVYAVLRRLIVRLTALCHIGYITSFTNFVQQT